MHSAQRAVEAVEVDRYEVEQVAVLKYECPKVILINN